MTFQVVEGQVARLARHKVANAVLELCYNEHSNGVQRNHFLQEFFGAGLSYKTWSYQLIDSTTYNYAIHSEV